MGTLGPPLRATGGPQSHRWQTSPEVMPRKAPTPALPRRGAEVPRPFNQVALINVVGAHGRRCAQLHSFPVKDGRPLTASTAAQIDSLNGITARVAYRKPSANSAAISLGWFT